jgi:formate/nitrite transporter FocA (FNT family)
MSTQYAPHANVVVNAYSPKEAIELCGRAGTAKANMRIDKIFMSSVMGGMLLSFACAVLLSTNTAPWFQDNAPGLIRTIGALVSSRDSLPPQRRERGGGV